MDEQNIENFQTLIRQVLDKLRSGNRVTILPSQENIKAIEAGLALVEKEIIPTAVEPQSVQPEVEKSASTPG
jgi:hypothetical protein